MDFKEECQADGTFTSEHKCKDIDWCDVNGGEEIDECDTEFGYRSCTEHGKCKDEVTKYSCECDEGYENVMTPLKLDSCQAVSCGNPPQVDFAFTESFASKITYKGTATYVCDMGYTLTGKSDGAIDFEIECKASGDFSKTKECKPIECDMPPSDKTPESKPNVTSLVFPGVAEYKCDNGHTLTGQADAPKTFNVYCTSTGQVSAYPKGCKKIQCPVVPSVKYSRRSKTGPVDVGDKVEIECDECYTTTGEADGPVSFSVKCEESGLFTDPEICSIVMCQPGKKAKYSTVTPNLHFFTCGQMQEHFCEVGFTTDGKPDGPSGWVTKCGTDGKMRADTAEDLKCKRIECPAPKATKNAKPKEAKKHEYLETATWECKDGYSITGLADGGKEFDMVCLADGTYGAGSPADCIDINYCVPENPCTANGLCKDLGPGKTSPGYECQCNDGYEPATDDDGNPTCEKDACDPDPCGRGGTC